MGSIAGATIAPANRGATTADSDASAVAAGEECAAQQSESRGELETGWQWARTASREQATQSHHAAAETDAASSANANHAPALDRLVVFMYPSPTWYLRYSAPC